MVYFELMSFFLETSDIKMFNIHYLYVSQNITTLHVKKRGRRNI
jgi:hypothetical protein